LEVVVVEASESERDVLSNLMQFYLYDMTELMNWDVPRTGRFPEDDLDGCWMEPWRHPFLFRADNELAGFSIVDSHSYLTGREDVHDLSEFFIMRRYRRNSLGTFAATLLFDRFPGRWEVREHGRNTAAIAFWRKVIGQYTYGRYEEIHLDSDLWRGPVQRFETR